jgi:prevent-host-death family protein
MRTVNIHEAKTQLSKLVEAASHGEGTIIAKAGKPAAMLIPITPNKIKRHFGGLKGQVKIAADFDKPLPDNIIADFEG